VVLGLFVSFGISVLIVLTKGWHGHHSMDSIIGVQKFHTEPTPRIGGLGIVLGLVAVSLALWQGCCDAAESQPLLGLLWPMLVSVLPAFVFGLKEDITKRVSVRTRMLATMASGVLAWWLTGISLTRVDFWGVDVLLQWLPVSVLFTAFAVSGVANAVNIVDGFNGLASGVVCIALVAMGIIAWRVGDVPLAQLCLLLFLVTLGFWLVNFPWGSLFLGDGGAYALGFMLAWVAVLLPMRNPEVSVWAGLLACSYPVLEVAFSVQRRLSRALHPGHPDRLHLHSLIKFRIVRKALLHWPANFRNAAVSPILWLYASVLGLFGVVFYDNTSALVGGLFFAAWFYRLMYRRLIGFKAMPRRAPLQKPDPGVRAQAVTTRLGD